MKKIAALLIAVLLVVSLTGCGSKPATNNAGETKQEVVTLKLASHNAVDHPYGKSHQWFINRVAELTNGSVKINYYPSEQLGKVADMSKLLQSGTTDMAFIAHGFEMAKFPLNSVMLLPYWTTASEGVAINQKLIDTVPELTEEYTRQGLKIVSIMPTAQFDLGTTKKPVTKPEDLKGLKMLVSGGYFNDIAQVYGIVPVNASPGEFYDMMQKGIVDGADQGIATIQGYKLSDMVKYQTLGIPMGGSNMYIAISDAAWAKLSPDQQKAVMQAGKEASVEEGKIWDTNVQKVKEEFVAKGITIYEPKGDEIAQWQAPMNGIEKKWVDDMNKLGKPGQKVFDAFRAACKEVTGR